MAEVVAIRTFIKLKVLEAIPETGSISLQELSGVTGAQASLLGMIKIGRSRKTILRSHWEIEVNA